jgi:uncharacterized protein YutE (UPF0331/DUF86 family)
MDDVVLNKVAIIERCLKRVNEEYAGDSSNLENFTRQDSIVLNIQRACEASIDLAMHVVAEKNLGVPQSSRDAFDLLKNASVISDELSDHMMAMVGFRNIAVHEYQQLSLTILQRILEERLADIKQFAATIMNFAQA